MRTVDKAAKLKSISGRLPHLSFPYFDEEYSSGKLITVDCGIHKEWRSTCSLRSLSGSGFGCDKCATESASEKNRTNYSQRKQKEAKLFFSRNKSRGRMSLKEVRAIRWLDGMRVDIWVIVEVTGLKYSTIKNTTHEFTRSSDGKGCEKDAEFCFGRPFVAHLLKREAGGR